MKIGVFRSEHAKKNRDEFINMDNGGVIYSVPSNTFDYDLNKGMGENEYVSRESVKPKKEEKFTSVLDTMIDNGVLVYFVNKDIFEKINKADDVGLSILKGLESENHFRNKEFVSPLEKIN